MKFTVTYWEHRQISAVAEKDEVLEALRSYSEECPGDPDAKRAASAAVDIGTGREPADLDIVAIALRECSFTAAEGTEPDQVDENTDYTADIRPS